MIESIIDQKTSTHPINSSPCRRPVRKATPRPVLIVPHAMRSFLLLGVLLLPQVCQGKACQGKDMAKDAPLHIAVTHKPEKCSKTSSKGDTLRMHYTGTLYSNCKKFDSSVGREPLSFTVGAGEVIKGWDTGLLGMCVGETRKLTIPANLGYGDNGAGDDIPGGATLQFQVELISIGS